MRSRVLLRIAALVSLSLAVIPLQVAANPASGGKPLRLHHLGRLVPLQGSLLPRLARAHRVGALAPSTRLGLALSLKVRDEAGLNRFLHDVYDPTSPRFHHFLTTREFAQRFAPSPQQRDAVRTWLAARGLHVTSMAANGLLIEANGTAGKVSAAFGTRLNRYVRGHERFFANSTPVHVPQALRSMILGVTGLDNAGRMRPAGIHRVLNPRSGVRASFDGYYPNDLRVAYDMAPMYDAGLNGAGQTIAVAEFADYSEANIRAYDQRFNLTTTAPQRVSVPYGGQEAKTGTEGQGEVELDLEVIHAIAPQARLLVYVSPENKGSGLVQANRIMSDNQARIVSVSWGFPESYVTTDLVASYNQITREGAAQGQATFIASGDEGAYDANGWFKSGDARNTARVIDYPSSDPWVTAVGGTSLTLSSTGYQGEIVWGNHSDQSGSGGGLSTYFRRPDWQQGPGVNNPYSNGARQTPDVAADADPRTGYAIYTTSKNKTGWYTFGGTSASAPLWAAYSALVQQYMRQPLGFLNPTLYALGQRQTDFSNRPFHDVTQGDNLYYKATSGWDYGTGWGSMDGAALLNDLVDMGGPVTSPPPSGGTPIPTVQPTPPAGNSVSFHVIAHWEKAGSKSGTMAPSLTSSKKGTKVQLGLYFQVDSAPAGLAVTAAFSVLYKGKTVASSKVTGSLDSTDPTGTYAAVKTFTPKQKGTYTFLGKVSMDGQTIARSAALTVR